MRYVSRPQQVEAIQWTGYNQEHVDEFVNNLALEALDLDPKVRFSDSGENGPHCELLAGQDGAQGWIAVPEGHYIVRWVDDPSDYWPMDPERFEKKYRRDYTGEVQDETDT